MTTDSGCWRWTHGKLNLRITLGKRHSMRNLDGQLALASGMELSRKRMPVLINYLAAITGCREVTIDF